MSISEIVGMISSIAAVFAIIISLFNVRELVKQRKQSIVPELIFKEGTFSIFNGSNTPIPLRWVGTNMSSDIEEAFALECFNIGLGSCKNVKLSWIYDIEPIIDKILRNNNEKAYRINYYKETQTIEIKMVTREFISSQFDLQSKAEYILPVSINKESTKFSLPMSYHVLCCILLELYLSQNNKDESFLDWPTLKVEASYDDVSGNKYKRSMNLKPKVIDVKQIENDMKPCARGWFEVSL